MLPNVTGERMYNVETYGSTAKRTVIGEHFEKDPAISSILYAMRDPKKGINCGGKKKMQVDEVKIPDSEFLNAGHLLAMLKNQALTRRSTFVSVGQTHIDGGHATLMGSSNDIGGANRSSAGSTDNAATTTNERRKGKEGFKTVYSQRYKVVMDALLKPVSSYTLLYEPHLVPTSKTPRKKVSWNSTLESLHKIRPEKKTPTKKKVQWGLFPNNVRSLTITGMLDGVSVQYLSALREKELPGIIKGTSYLCGCQSCNFSELVTADVFEDHAGCKTSHPNNHIHLENGKSLHKVVQELKNTPTSMLCDAIQTVIGASLNKEAFFSWKGSFEAAKENSVD